MRKFFLVAKIITLLLQFSTATEEKCQIDCTLPTKKGLCPSGPTLMQRYNAENNADPSDKLWNTGEDIMEQLGARAFQLRFKQIDFTYCSNLTNQTGLSNNATTIFNYVATVRPISRLAGASVIENTRKIETNEWIIDRNETPGKNGYYKINTTQLRELGFTSPEFSFYGHTYTDVTVSSNGFLTFNGSDTSNAGSISAVFASGLPRICAFFTRLAPELVPQESNEYTNDTNVTFGRVPDGAIDGEGEHLVVTFNQVPLEGDKHERSSFQVSLWPQSGKVRLAWTDVSNQTNAVVGISSGPGPADLMAYRSYRVPFEDYNGCVENPMCLGEQNTRLVGPTRPSDPDVYLFGLHETIHLDLTRPHPWARSPKPNPYMKFCQIGCTYYYNQEQWGTYPQREVPSVVVENWNTLSACLARCNHTFRYDITTGYSDIAEMARLECWDGCQIANLRCQPGYSCFNGDMNPCKPGTYRHNDYTRVEQCYDCPNGRYRDTVGGREMESCAECPIGKYANQTQSSSITYCLRCPAGRWSHSPGQALCDCITELGMPQACDKKHRLSDPGQATLEDVNLETFHELREIRNSVPFTGRF